MRNVAALFWLREKSQEKEEGVAVSTQLGSVELVVSLEQIFFSMRRKRQPRLGGF